MFNPAEIFYPQPQAAKKQGNKRIYPAQPGPPPQNPLKQRHALFLSTCLFQPCFADIIKTNEKVGTELWSQLDKISLAKGLNCCDLDDLCEAITSLLRVNYKYGLEIWENLDRKEIELKVNNTGSLYSNCSIIYKVSETNSEIAKELLYLLDIEKAAKEMMAMDNFEYFGNILPDL